MRVAPTRPLSLTIGGMLALGAVMGVGRFVYTPILPFMVAGLGLSSSEAGLIASANFVGYLAGALLVAMPWVRGSRRAWLLWGMALSAATTGAMALGSGLAWFMAVRFLGGVASAVALVFASALVLERLAAAGRSELSSLYFAGVGVIIAGSALLIAAAAAAGFDWRAFWLTGAGATLLCLATTAWLVPDAATSDADTPRGPRPAGKVPGLLTTAYGLFGFGYVITATFLVALVRSTPALAPIEPWIWVIVGVAATPSVAMWAWAGRRIGLGRAFAAACFVEAIGVAVSVAGDAPVFAFLAALLLGGTFSAIAAIGLAAAQASSPGDPRRIMAVMTVVFGVGQIAGPAFAGWAHDATGSYVLPTLAAAAALVLAAALAAVRREP